MKRYSLQVGSDPPREDPEGTWVRIEDIAQYNISLLQYMSQILDLNQQVMNIMLAMRDLMRSQRRHGEH